MKKITSHFQALLVLAILATALAGGTNYEKVFGSDLSEKHSCNEDLMSPAELAEYRGISLEIAQGIHTRGFLRFSNLCNASQSELDQAIINLENAADVGEFRRLQLQGENGEISADIYAESQEQYNELIAQQGLNAASAGIDTGSWNWIGPGNIGGRVRALAIHPSDKNIMWAGGISGGIWKTINGGASWQIQDDFMESMAVTSIVINPADSDLLYASTGEGIGESNTVSRWIFKTTDGGSTWTQLDRGTDNTNADHVHNLAISPNGDTLLAATEDGVMRCSEANSGNNCQDNTDWTKIYSTATYEVTDIEFRTTPSSTQTVVAGGESGLVMHSTNVKVGTPTWTPVALEAEGVGMGRVEVAYASDSTVYLSAAVVDYDPSLDGAHIYKSTNDGASFTRNSPAGRTYFPDESGNEANTLWVDPSDATQIIMGGGNLYRSTDSGVTITQISDGTQAPSSAFSGQHIAVSGSNNQVIFGTDGGIYRADDIDSVTTTSGWTELNNNLGITEFYSVAVTAGGDIVGGTRGTGTIRHANGASTEAWTVTEDGEGGFIAADPLNDNRIYGSFTYLKIFRNNNGVFTDISGGISDAGDSSTANAIAPFVLDPNNASRMLAGGDQLWKTDDVKAATPAWSSIKSSIGSNITAIAVGNNSSKIWVGHEDGRVYKDINTQVDENGSNTLPDRQVTRIIVKDDLTIYVTFAGFSVQNVWKTTDGGNNWNPLGDFPLTTGAPVYDLVIRPSSTDLYIGTEFGVFASDDAGVSWSASSDADGPTSSSVQDLYINGSTLIAATYGRGIFTVEIGASVDPAHDDFANPVILPIDFGEGTSLPYRYPPSGYTDTSNATRAGDDPAMADCDIAPGNASVWYKYVPDSDIDLAIDTKGSNYDTYLALWTGDRGNLTPIACNNDISGSDADSQVGVSFTGSTTYYIEAGEYNGDISGASVGGNLVLNIDDTVYSVGGTITETEGSPIAGATVKAAGQSATTNGSGAYTLFPIPDGNITVIIEATGYVTKTEVINVNSDTTNQNFTLEAEKYISGTIRNSSGTPMAGVTVRTDTGTPISTTTAGDGTYTLTSVPSGEVRVLAEANGYGTKLRVLTISGSVTGIDFTLSTLPSFIDVPMDYWSWTYVEDVYTAGVTSGCGGDNYCPTGLVTRAQMAVFLLKAKHGSNYSPPPASGNVFGDVPETYWAAKWIEQLVAEGVTAGCGNGNYCPDAIVNRAQMAVFLLKAEHGSSYSPPSATGVFTDVPVGYWADKWIEQLSNEGITGGCGGGNYCPSNPVNRGQMAVFLVKTFNLP
jgi:hypothetical protein